MQTHSDGNHKSDFMDRLRERAEQSKKDGTSQITTGRDGEESLAAWEAEGVQVVHMPDDPQGILRISIGGGNNTPVPLDYCTIRGDAGQCIALLEKAIAAIKGCPY